MRDEGALHLGGAETVARDVQNIIKTAGDPKVAFLVAASSVSGGVDPVVIIPVGITIALFVAIDCPEHRWPGFSDDKLSAFVGSDFFAGFIEDGGIDPEEGEGGGSGSGGGATGKGRDHDCACFGLPPGIDNGATFTSDSGMIPHPCFRVDGLAHSAEEAE